MAERSITIKFLGDPAGGKKAFQDVGQAAGTFEGKIDGLGSKFGTFAGTMAGVVTGGALAALPGILMDGARGAAEDEAAMGRLKTAVENTGTAYDSRSKAIDDAIKKGQDLAFTDGETATALATLVALTGDTDEGMRRLSLAQDLARGTGMDLDTAAKLLGKTSEENTSALSRYGIQLGKNATAQDVLNAVDAKFGGQAGTFAESDAGKMLKSQQAMGELSETAGSLLLPVLGLVATATMAFANGLSTLIGFLEPVTNLIANNLAPILIAVAPALALIGGAILTTLVPAFIAWTGATLTQLAATLGLNAAMLPMIAVFVAIGVAVAALYLAWQSNFLGIQDITKQVIDWLMPYLTAAWDGIKAGFDAALKFILDLWNTVFPAIQTVVETVMPIISTVAKTYITILKTEIEIAVGIVRTVFETVFPILQSIVETVFPIIATVVSTYIGLAQSAIETALGIIKGAWDLMWPAIQSVTETVMGGVKTAVDTGMAIVGVIQTGLSDIKTAFDTILVPVQGVVSDVFTTIQGLVSSLWLGATGAVSLVGAGLATIKGFFSGAYETFVGYGKSIVDGLMAGLDPIISRIQTIIDGIMAQWDRIPSFLRPGSPSKWATEMGKSLTDGLVAGMQSGMPALEQTVSDINAVLGGVQGWWNGVTVPPGGNPVAPLVPPVSVTTDPTTGEATTTTGTGPTGAAAIVAYQAKTGAMLKPGSFNFHDGVSSSGGTPNPTVASISLTSHDHPLYVLFRRYIDQFGSYQEAYKNSSTVMRRILELTAAWAEGGMLSEIAINNYIQKFTDALALSSATSGANANPNRDDLGMASGIGNNGLILSPGVGTTQHVDGSITYNSGPLAGQPYLGNQAAINANIAAGLVGGTPSMPSDFFRQLEQSIIRAMAIGIERGLAEA